MNYKDNSNQTSKYKLPDLSYNTGTIGTILSQLESYRAPNLQLHNNHYIWRNAQQIVSCDHIINIIQELLQEDVYADDEEGNAAQI